MEIRKQILTALMVATACAGLALPSGIADAAVVLKPTMDGAVSEDSGNGQTDSGAWNGAGYSTVWNNTNRNEWMVLQYNLAGVDKASITGISINLTLNQAVTLNDTSLAVFATSGQALSSSTKFSTLPGLTWDGNSSTRGENTAIATSVGSCLVAGKPAEGTVINLQPTGLLTYVQNMNSDTLTILINYTTPDSGGRRFYVASSRATTLSSGGTPVEAGTYAPTLTITTVPEAATLSLLTIGASTLLLRPTHRDR